MTFLEAQTALCRKLNIDYTDISNNGLFSLNDIKEYLLFGLLRAWDYKPWDFTEGAKVLVSTDSEYFDYPEDFATGSIYLLTVGGEEYTKLDFKDYLKWKQDYPSDDDKYYTEHNRWYFINQNAYTVGDEINVFGKLKPIKPSADADLMPFSPDSDENEYSGNEAIVLLGYASALSSEKKKNPAQAQVEEKRAYLLLDILWKPFAQSRAVQQTKDRPFFNVPDYYSGNNLTNIDSIFN